MSEAAKRLVLRDAAEELLRACQNLSAADNDARRMADYRTHADFNWLRQAAQQAREAIAKATL